MGIIQLGPTKVSKWRTLAVANYIKPRLTLIRNISSLGDVTRSVPVLSRFVYSTLQKQISLDLREKVQKHTRFES